MTYMFKKDKDGYVNCRRLNTRVHKSLCYKCTKFSGEDESYIWCIED